MKWLNFKMKDRKINIKDIDWRRTILSNFGSLSMFVSPIAYLLICLNAINKYEFSDPIIKLPFIIIIAMSVIFLVGRFQPNPIVFLKLRKSDFKHDNIDGRILCTIPEIMENNKK